MERRLSVICVLVFVLGFVSLPAAGTLGTTQSVWAEEPARAEQVACVDINTAPLERLATIKGIGEKTAQAIVAYREANGPFTATEDIMNVKGVGERKYEAIKDQITVGKAK